MKVLLVDLLLAVPVTVEFVQWAGGRAVAIDADSDAAVATPRSRVRLIEVERACTTAIRSRRSGRSCCRTWRGGIG